MLEPCVSSAQQDSSTSYCQRQKYSRGCNQQNKWKLSKFLFAEGTFFPMKNVEGMKGRLDNDFYNISFPISNLF